MEMSLPKTRSMMDRLPLAILQVIFESVAHNDTQSRHSVRAIALTSKHYCAAIDRERFKHVKLVFWSRPDLEVAIKRWTDVLQQDDRYRHVRYLSIIEKTEPWTGYNAETYKRSFLASSPEDLHRVFTALTDLASSCVALKDLSWESDEPVPIMLLNMMSQQQPQARLHVHPFNLQSLIQSRDKLHDIGHEDYSLATSPNLYSFNVTEGYFTGEGDIDYNGDAIPFWVSGMAPNLRCVDVTHQIPGNTPDLVQALRMVRPKWQGPFKGMHSSNLETQGRLRQLTLRGDKPLSQAALQEWSRVTDVSVLMSLTLMIQIKEAVIHDLSDMAERGLFRCLRSFSMNVYGDTSVGLHRLIAAFPPLESITVFKETRELRGYIIRCHGETLRDFHLTELLELEDLILLSSAAPELRSLNMAIARRNGDAKEVKCYQALGRFPKLQKLTLHLSYRGPVEVFVEYFSKEEAPSEEQIQDFRHVLTNMAIDERLAQEIFNTISRASQRARPELIPQFVRLELRLYDGDADHGPYGGFSVLQNYMARRWLCERRYADLYSVDSWMTEIDVLAREAARKELEYYLENNWSEFEEDAIYEAAWKAEWPQAKDKKDWLDHWHSSPLWQGNE